MTKKKRYEKELLEAIEKHKIDFFDHCFAFVSFSSSTAYNHELEKVETIKEKLAQNRVKAKNYMLNKWIEGDNATLQVAAMRLLSSSEEHQKLNQSYIDHTSKGKKMNKGINIVTDTKKDAEEIQEMIEKFKEKDSE